MIPYYMVGKLAPNPTHSTRGLVKHVPGGDYFRAVPSQIRDKFVTPPPQSLNGSNHEIIVSLDVFLIPSSKPVLCGIRNHVLY